MPGMVCACALACGAEALWATTTTVGNSMLSRVGAGWLCMPVTTVLSQVPESAAASVRAISLGIVRRVMVVSVWCWDEL